MVVVGGRQSPIPSGPSGSVGLERVAGSDMLSQEAILSAIERLGQRMDTQVSGHSELNFTRSPVPRQRRPAFC